MFAKPEPRRRVKARTDRQKAKARKDCVSLVWARANNRCQDCGRHVCKPRETDNPFDVGHVHEVIPRSRGGDPTDPEQCILACVKCHTRRHGQRVAD